MMLIRWIRALCSFERSAGGGPDSLQVKSAGVGGVSVRSAQRKVVIGIVAGDAGVAARICVLPPWAARQLAFDLWAAAGRCDRALEVH